MLETPNVDQIPSLSPLVPLSSRPRPTTQVTAQPFKAISEPRTTTPPKHTMGSSQSSSKYSKRGKISDEDMLKYTGKTKDELQAWAKDEPGVGGNQAAGKLTMGPTSGVAGMA